MKRTLVIGASTNPDRYSFKAINRLVQHGHEVLALGLKTGEVAGVVFDTEKQLYKDIDTVTLYVGPQNQTDYMDYIESLRPRRVIFNPGTENTVFEQRLRIKGIQTEQACTLVLLATDLYDTL
ncbi:MAG: CoA-binding protein [Paludibacteraceae bacterium]|nr:CoA-binding protein [Paludibacteraceae bacterium]MBN2787186.1 CoA-binding protein [Paludibacteraceae bacterium]